MRFGGVADSHMAKHASTNWAPPVAHDPMLTIILLYSCIVKANGCMCRKFIKSDIGVGKLCAAATI